MTRKTSDIKKLSVNIIKFIKNKYNKNVDNKQIIKILKNNKKIGICKFNSCNKQASYGKLGSKFAEYCVKHKPVDYVNVVSKTCIYDDCNKQASYGKLGSKLAEYCKKHKLVDYVNVVSKTCIYENCNTRPSYGKLGSKLAEYCAEHKLVDYVDIKSKKCIYDSCNTQPTYGKLGSKLAEYCAEHKLVDYVNVKNKTCIYDDCNKQASYGNPYSKLREYCKKHKLVDYVNVVSKTCIYENCNKQSVYGKLGSKLREYCAEHKLVDYVNVVTKTCIYENCNKQSVYGKVGSKLSEYCAEHKLVDYVNIISKKCIYENCNKQSVYGKVGSKLREYCVEHKPTDYVDVKHKTCIVNNCDTRASFGKLFCNKIHCAKHKQSNEYVKNNPTCINCNQRPSYTNGNNNYPLRCETHKLDDDLDVISSICSNCGLTDYIKSGNVCNDCSIFGVIRKTQENIIKVLLDDNKIQYDSYDKIIKDGCSLKRPDFVFDLGDRIIVLEVDENQHSSYLCECEQKRMIQIHQDYGGLDVCFIRYNPDRYKDNNNKLIKNNNGRHKNLITTLNSLKIHNPKYNLSVIYLYYDGYDGNNKIEPINY